MQITKKIWFNAQRKLKRRIFPYFIANYEQRNKRKFLLIKIRTTK